jgi:7-cyano-7-deazaguanine synthase
MTYDAIVLHSGGMDSSLCLLLAAKQYGNGKVISLGVRYQQRHHSELAAAEEIAAHYGIRREVLDMAPLPGWDSSSLIAHSLPIESSAGCPNSVVLGRNGLFLMMVAPMARSVGAHSLFIGVMEREGSNSGYPDCNRSYIDSVQTVIRLDLQDSSFSIQTPLIEMSKAETLELADSLGALEFLLQHTVTCYNGVPLIGCQECPSCRLRNAGIAEFYRRHPAKKLLAPFAV